MPIPTENVNVNLALNIRIRLNAENNVIFVNCDGFETEIFMPTVIDGRLSIINVVPQRRCKCISTTHIVSKPHAGNARKLTPNQQRSNSRLSTSTNQQFYTSTPMRNTAINLGYVINENNVSCSYEENDAAAMHSLQNNNVTIIENANDEAFELLSPQPIRGTSNTCNEARKILPIRLNQSLRNETYQTMDEMSIEFVQNQSDVISTALSSPPPQNVSMFTDFLSIMEYPRTPPSQKGNASHRTSKTASPAQLQWPAVLKTTRTYSRLKYSPNKSATSYLSSSLDLHRKHLAKATQGIKAKDLVIFKTKRKRINKTKLDEKIYISPRSFRQQMQYEKAVAHHQALRADLNERQLAAAKKSVFDFFTTPTVQSQCFATELFQQFRSRCVNKGSSTYPKYKKLAKLPLTEVTKSKAVLVEPIDMPVSEYSLISVDDDSSIERISV